MAKLQQSQSGILGIVYQWKYLLPFWSCLRSACNSATVAGNRNLRTRGAIALPLTGEEAPPHFGRLLPASSLVGRGYVDISVTLQALHPPLHSMK